MSMWGDMYKRGNGELIRKEDKLAIDEVITQQPRYIGNIDANVPLPPAQRGDVVADSDGNVYINDGYQWRSIGIMDVHSNDAYATIDNIANAVTSEYYSY